VIGFEEGTILEPEIQGSLAFVSEYEERQSILCSDWRVALLSDSGMTE